MYKWKDGFEPDICDKDEQCRYILGKKGKNTLICIGANPSVAESSECDATELALYYTRKQWLWRLYNAKSLPTYRHKSR